ncbi:cadherin-8 [Striga asiatica]|uniref:Cadherin-8 n=1 Tax=Striga asiatica TaxID=4170 RepID=A0A5A7PWV0_STRAF|nr:cadherin-8 [Striga asiatica]
MGKPQRSPARALGQGRFVEDLLVGHRARPPDADVGELARGAHDPLDGDGVARFLVAVRVALVEVCGHVGLGGDDRDVGGVHGPAHAGDPAGEALEGAVDVGGGGVVRPPEEFGHEDGADGGADLEDELVASGDAEAEALGDLAEGLAGGQTPDADGDALPDGDGLPEHGVFLGDHGLELVADQVECGPAHPEIPSEMVLRVIGAVHLLPPRLRPALHPEPPLGAGAAAAVVGRRIGLGAGALGAAGGLVGGRRKSVRVWFDLLRRIEGDEFGEELVDGEIVVEIGAPGALFRVG